MLFQGRAGIECRRAGAARLRSLQLLQIRRRQACWLAPSSRMPGPGRTRGIPEDFSFGEIAGDFDALRAGAAGRHAPCAGAGERRHSEVFLRPGKLYPRRALSPGRVAGTRPTALWRRASIPSACNRPAASARSSANGSATAIRPLTSGRSTCAATMPFQTNRKYLRERVCGKSRAAVCDALAVPAVRIGPRRAQARRCTIALASAGACFGEAFGWERANWYAPPGVEPRVRVQLRPPELVRAQRP